MVKSLVRSRVESLGIEPDAFGKFDFHVHVPAGAVPKDGPSAGVAMFTALASLFAGRAVNKDVAMTGEITLRGVVLPIGGLKEKTLAALNAGITTVLIPKLNEKDIAELPPQIREGLTIVPVATVDEVIEHALLPAVEDKKLTVSENLGSAEQTCVDQPKSNVVSNTTTAEPPA